MRRLNRDHCSIVKFYFQLIRKRKFCSKLSPNTKRPTFSYLEMENEMKRRIGLKDRYDPELKSREELLQYQPRAEDLPERSIRDSFCSVIIPLRTNSEMQEKFVSHLGHVRAGRLLEEMDLFATWVCLRHVHVPTLAEDVQLPYTFVTLLVDKVEFSRSIYSAIEDLRLSGYVSFTGRTTMEINISIERKLEDTYEPLSKGIFVMVARNATNTGPAPTNQLKATDEEDERIICEGQERQKARLLDISKPIFQMQPSMYEQKLMFDLFKRTTPMDTMEVNKRILPTNCSWMSNSLQQSVILSFPQHRNAQNTVFGGFIMRCALETSWICACCYCRTRPRLEFIYKISFRKPVHVDSFIKVSAYVVYTKSKYMQIMTLVDILDGSSGNQVTTNKLHFVFSSPDTVSEVLPRSFHETMLYIQARREFMNSIDGTYIKAEIENETENKN